MPAQDSKTFIAEDVEVTGSIKCASNIQVDGTLNGDLVCSGNAIVGASAKVKGNIAVESVTVLGQINGNITAKDRIELKSSTRLIGDIRAKRLTVEDGVSFVGKSEVNPTAGPVPSASRTPSVDEVSEPATLDERDNRAKTSGLFGKR